MATSDDTKRPEPRPKLTFDRELLGKLAQSGTQGLELLARAYLGPVAVEQQTKVGTSMPLLGLAVAKLAYEAGELALHNPNLEATGAMPKWAPDEQGRMPALSLAHVLAAVRAWSAISERRQTVSVQAPMMRMDTRALRYATRSSYYASRSQTGARVIDVTATSRTSEGYRMASQPHAHAHAYAPAPSYSTTASRGGCGSCGGSHATPPPAPPPYDPCAGGIRPAARATERCSGCGGGGGGCSCGSKSTRTYDREQCPTFAISCETKNALRDCVKVALCDFARCLADALCPDGRYDSAIWQGQKGEDTQKKLNDCIGQLACSFLHCLPDALCPPEDCVPPPPVECLPCGFAVEVQR